MKVHTIQITLSLREGEDDDVLAYFARHSPQQQARTLLTWGLKGVPPVTDEAELTAMLDDLFFHPPFFRLCWHEKKRAGFYHSLAESRAIQAVVGDDRQPSPE